MVHSPIAVHPEAADKDWAAPGTFPLLAPPWAAPPDWERLTPDQRSKQIKKKKKSKNPLSLLLHLKEGNEERNRSAPRPMGQLARSRERAQPPVPSRDQVRSPRMPGRGAGRGWQRAGPRALARPREISPPGLGAREGSGHQPPRLALQRAPGAPGLPPARPGRSERSWLTGSGIRGRRL